MGEHWKDDGTKSDTERKCKSIVKMNLLWRIEEGKKEQEHFVAVKNGHCDTPHTGMCELKTGADFTCGKLGHQVRDCPK